MSALITIGWDVIWRPHWPVSICSAGGEHTMEREFDTWRCTDCGVWFEVSDLHAVLGATQRANQMIADKHRQN